MAAAPRWGAIAASSRVIGALLSLARPWPRPLVSLVLARGPEALISAVSFELAQEGAEVGGAAWHRIRGLRADVLPPRRPGQAPAKIWLWLTNVSVLFGGAFAAGSNGSNRQEVQ